MRREWSDQESEILNTMWAEGASASQIARKLGPPRTRCSVLGRVHRSAGIMKPRAPVRKTQSLAFAPPFVVPKVPVKKLEGGVDEDPGPMCPPIDTMAVRDHHCKWPYNTEDGYHYCGQLPKQERPFCPYHCKKAYQPQMPRRSAA